MCFLLSDDPVQRLHDISCSGSCGKDLPAFPQQFHSDAASSTSLHLSGLFVSFILRISNIISVIIPAISVILSAQKTMLAISSNCSMFPAAHSVLY